MYVCALEETKFVVFHGNSVLMALQVPFGLCLIAFVYVRCVLVATQNNHFIRGKGFCKRKCEFHKCFSGRTIERRNDRAMESFLVLAIYYLNVNVLSFVEVLYICICTILGEFVQLLGEFQKNRLPND